MRPSTGPHVQTALSRIDNEAKVRRDAYLLKYQVDQAFNESRLRAWEKSIRIGATYEKAFEAVRDRLIPGKGNYLHTSVTQQVAQAFLEDCEFWLGCYNAAGAVVARNQEDWIEALVDDQDQPVRGPDGQQIHVVRRAFEWVFDTRQKLTVFSSNPQALRGFGGAVGVDEIAFHVRMTAMLQAAGGRAIWGYPVSLWSSHNGEDSEWNMFLSRERQAGAASLWSLQRTTLLDAIADGLVEKINATRGLSLTRDQFIAQTKALLGSIEAYLEECLCEPQQRGLPAVAWIVIQAAQKDYRSPVIAIDGDAKLGDVIDPAVAAVIAVNPWKELPRDGRYALGFDVARSGHLSSIHVKQTDGRRHRTVMHIKMHNCKLPGQRELIALGLDTLPAMTGGGDMGGLGRSDVEQLADRYPGRFNAVDFGTLKPYIVGKLKAAYDDGRNEIPRDQEELAYDVRAVLTKTVGTHLSYTESRNPLNAWSHCDMAYAEALAIANAEDSAGAPFAWQPLDPAFAGAQQDRQFGMGAAMQRRLAGAAGRTYGAYF